MSALSEATRRLAITSAMPPKVSPGDYLSLDELETIAWHFREHGVSILAAQGVNGPEWHLTVPIKGVQTRYRAHRVPSSDGAA